MAIDFGGLATTDNYSTAYTPKINEAVKALAYMLDPAYASYTGTPFTNAKRFNGGSLEKFNGTIWVAQALGGAFNGTVGATTPSTGAFTALSASGAASVGAGLAVTGALSVSGAISNTGGFIAISGGINPYLSLSDGTGAGYIQVYLGDIDITPRAGKNITLSAPTYVTGALSVTGVISATGGLGSTALNASNLGSGTVPDARFPATLPAASGANLTSLNASNLGSGTVPAARIGSSTAYATGVLTANGKAYTPAGSVAFSATPTFDASASNFHIFGALTANVTAITLSNAQEGQFLTIRFTQDGTGGRTITTGNMGATNAPSITGSPTTTANKASYLNLTYNATAARWEGSWLGTV